ncbi:MAG: hypothetical protein QM677_01060 [Microbacterium sp.]
MTKTLATITAVAALVLVGSTGAYAADGEAILDTARNAMAPEPTLFLTIWISGGVLAFTGGAVAVSRSVRRARRVEC